MSAPRVLIVGSGGREHALAWKLSKSPRQPKLYALPGSSAIGQLAECVTGDPLNPPAVIEICKQFEIGLVVVGPEAPLAAGLADGLETFGIPCFGPRASAARLESSKAFAKDFLRRHRLPTARYEVYDDPVKAADAAAELDLPLVVKADGLAAGKGVRVCATRKEALQAVQDFMVAGSLGASGKRVVLEECLRGPEATVMAFCDGERLAALPPSQDHKRLLDADAGPNTGGMGAVAPVPDIPEATQKAIAKILEGTVAGLKADGLPYRGVLYCGLMLTEDGPKVLEYNVRFGDPETQAVLPLLDGNLLDVLEACAAGRLDPAAVKVRAEAAASIVLASEGYPEKPVLNRRITGIEAAELEADTVVFHAGTRRTAEGWMSSGGRVLNVVATGSSLRSARSKAYTAAAKIHFDGLHYRKDIGARY